MRRLLPVLPLLLLGAVVGVFVSGTAGPLPVSRNRVSAPAPGVADIAASVERHRGLKFIRTPRFIAAEPAVILERWRTARTEQSARLKKKVWCAMGFRWEPDWPVVDAFAGLEVELRGSFYDLERGEFFYDSRDAPAVRPEEQARLTQAIALVLVGQHRGAVSALESTDDGESLSRASLLEAEAAAVSRRCLLTVPPLPLDAPQPVPFYASPRFLRELMLFPREAGGVLADRFTEGSPGFAAFDNAWKNPPGSVGTLQEWANDGRQSIRVSPPVVSCRTPLVTGTLGWVGLRTLLRSQLTKPEAVAGSAGLTGDAYSLYAGDGFVWDTRWASDENAVSFSEGVSRTLGQAFGAHVVRTGGPPGGFTGDGVRSFRIRREGTRVWVITAPERDFVLSAAMDLTDPLPAVTTRR